MSAKATLIDIENKIEVMDDNIREAEYSSKLMTREIWDCLDMDNTYKSGLFPYPYRFSHENQRKVRNVRDDHEKVTVSLDLWNSARN